MTYLQRKAAKKKVWERCKKVNICPHCGATNGNYRNCLTYFTHFFIYL